MCPLCFSEHVRNFAVVDDKKYWRCGVCQLTFLSSEHHLDEDAELARYQLHENSPDDARYREFLSRLERPPNSPSYPPPPKDLISVPDRDRRSP